MLAFWASCVVATSSGPQGDWDRTVTVIDGLAEATPERNQSDTEVKSRLFEARSQSSRNKTDVKPKYRQGVNKFKPNANPNQIKTIELRLHRN